MDYINLVNPDDIYSFKYEVSHFPDGQHSLNLIESESRDYTFDALREHAKKHGITIKSRLNSFEDLEIILCATQALKNLGIKRIRLYIPYCLGGRSDRKFVKGGINYIKDVIAPIINLQGYEEVEIMDPHSYVLEACINNFSKIDNKDLIDHTFKDYFLSKGHTHRKQENIDKILLVSPDAGALKKIYGVAQHIGYQSDVIVATKYRNPITGQIEKTNVPMSVNDAHKDVFIIDDIGDGFGTFVEIAKTIQQVRNLSSSVKPEHFGKNYLVITHSIQEAGIIRALNVFEKIYTTNSINDWEIENLNVLNVF